MSFVVAGAVLVLASIVGVISLMAVPYYESKKNTDNEAGAVPDPAPAASISGVFRRENTKDLIFVLFAVLLCIAAGFMSARSSLDVLGLIRQNSVSLLLMSAMIIDRKTHLLPNLISLLILALGAVLLLFEFIFYRETFGSVLFAGLIGFLLCFVVFYILSRLTRDGIGMGDVKLIGVLGWILGLELTLITVLFALIICALFSLLLIFGKKKNKNDSVPFGPFLFFGYILMIILLGI